MQKISFPTKAVFFRELKKRVDDYFVTSQKKKTGDWRMYSKTAVILALLGTSYTYLVFYADSLLPAIVAAVALAQSFILVGFNIMHDGAHGSYSGNSKVNWVMGFVGDIIGGNQMLWKQKHNILHHTYTNLAELDDDLNTNGLLRLSPHQSRRSWHRFQHFYALPLYSLLTLTWIAYNDFQKFFTGRIGSYQLRKAKPQEVFTLFLMKAFYLTYMLVIPMFFHPVLVVLGFFLFIHLLFGLTMSVIFQLAHTVAGNKFPQPDLESGALNQEWAVHQLETTADFAQNNWFLTWYLGGLNFQVEHHLFTKVCHIHYPALARIVQETCREYAVDYHCHPGLFSALLAHLRFLREMGRQGTSA
ncbi:MAG: acyl-CoA desaturase [Acidobacteriota bacterium]|nr:MAG: acyl-CoA desaturase [Acidobacteriota bacterium]